MKENANEEIIIILKEKRRVRRTTNWIIRGERPHLKTPTYLQRMGSVWVIQSDNNDLSDTLRCCWHSSRPDSSILVHIGMSLHSSPRMDSKNRPYSSHNACVRTSSGYRWMCQADIRSWLAFLEDSSVRQGIPLMLAWSHYNHRSIRPCSYHSGIRVHPHRSTFQDRTGLVDQNHVGSTFLWYKFLPSGWPSRSDTCTGRYCCASDLWTWLVLKCTLRVRSRIQVHTNRLEFDLRILHKTAQTDTVNSLEVWYPVSGCWTFQADRQTELLFHSDSSNRLGIHCRTPRWPGLVSVSSASRSNRHNMFRSVRVDRPQHNTCLKEIKSEEYSNSLGPMHFLRAFNKGPALKMVQR